MSYIRPVPLKKPSRPEKQALLREYFAHYAAAAEADPTVLNRKIPREAFADVLDSLGELLVSEAARLARTEGAVRDFLRDNPLPPLLAGRLPDEFRAFCLLLNALKQWISAEQAATDRYLLGGTARAECRAAAEHCMISGNPLSRESTDLHHPVRDGRPPIPLSKAAHAELEGQHAGPKPTRQVRVRAEAISGTRSDATSALRGNAYSASRLAFKASVIDRLEADQAFRIETPGGTFEMTRTEFETTFANVAESPTYRKTGSYSYASVPRKALRFLIAPG